MDGNTNAFATSLQQLMQYLNQQNAGTGSGLSLASGQTAGANGQPFNLGSGQQPTKVVTQVHYDTTPNQTSTDLGQPAVSTPPPAPQVSTFAPPGGGVQALPQPNPVTVPQGSGGGGQGGGQRSIGGTGMADMGSIGGTGYGSPYSIETGDTSGWDGGGAASAAGGGAGGAGKLGGGISSALSGIGSALSKAGQNIADVKTMPTPVQTGPFPQINQYTPTLIGRRTQRPY